MHHYMIIMITSSVVNTIVGKRLTLPGGVNLLSYRTVP
jgi:hypothetical protein